MTEPVTVSVDNEKNEGRQPMTAACRGESLNNCTVRVHQNRNLEAGRTAGYPITGTPTFPPPASGKGQETPAPPRRDAMVAIGPAGVARLPARRFESRASLL